MAHLAKFLSPRLIIVATLHGRWSQFVHEVTPCIRQDCWEEILQDYSSTGLGYREYCKGESHQFISGSYDISIAKPHVTIAYVEETPNTGIFLCLERAWGDHHDVVASGRPSYAERWPHPVVSDGLSGG